MKDDGGIVELSLPFVAGILAVAYLPLKGLGWAWPCGIGLAGVTAALLLAISRSGRASIPMWALLFFTGIVVGAGDSLSGGLHLPACSIFPHALISRAADEALQNLLGLIDGCNFRHEGTAALLKALLTGRRECLDSGVVTAFREAGASHVLALSGLHLGVIYGIFSKICALLGRSMPAMVARSVLIVAASGFYVVMTGASPSIVRAFLFITIGEALRLCPERRRNPLGVLCLALVVQLACSPDSVRSVGFQLSYLAMTGIFVLYPRLEAWYPAGGRSPVRKVWQSIALTVSCQVFTAPLSWLVFRTFPKYFILTNILALPLTEALMLSAIATLILTAAGIQCVPTLWLTDLLATALQRSLSIIAAM